METRGTKGAWGQGKKIWNCSLSSTQSPFYSSLPGTVVKANQKMLPPLPSSILIVPCSLSLQSAPSKYACQCVCVCVCCLYSASEVVLFLIMTVIMTVMRTFFFFLHMLLSLQAPTCPQMSADYIHNRNKLSPAHSCKPHALSAQVRHLYANAIMWTAMGARRGPAVSDVVIVKEGLEGWPMKEQACQQYGVLNHSFLLRFQRLLPCWLIVQQNHIQTFFFSYFSPIN